MEQHDWAGSRLDMTAESNAGGWPTYGRSRAAAHGRAPQRPVLTAARNPPCTARLRYERPVGRLAIRVPSWRVEYAYYSVISYSMLAEYLGVEVPLLAAGLTVGMAAYCCIQLGSRAAAVLAPLRFLFACVVTFLAIQVLWHGVSPSDVILRSLVVWTCWLIIVQSLCLRDGFLRRCTLVLIAIGCAALPTLGYQLATVDRLASYGLGGNLGNANGFGSWFGLCFVAAALLGLETKRVTRRALYWAAAVGFLLVTALSVSRGALIGSAIAFTVGFRDVFKRGFWPLLLLIVIGGVVVESGVFDRAISLYETRGLEDTGRQVLWPRVS
jgi:hypothetical protein